jgi:hypothetical protein
MWVWATEFLDSILLKLFQQHLVLMLPLPFWGWSERQGFRTWKYLEAIFPVKTPFLSGIFVYFGFSKYSERFLLPNPVTQKESVPGTPSSKARGGDEQWPVL